MTAELAPLIQAAAERHGLPVALVRAIVRVESDGNPWAARYEPGFYDRYVAPKPIRGKFPCSAQTESRLQATSFGLMQIMGATAREVGFSGVFLTELCDPATGLDWACRYLARLIHKYGSEERAVAAYNAGSPRKTPENRWVNQPYVDKIRAAGGLS